jgi:hypothetical protein
VVVGVTDESSELIEKYIRDNKIEFPIARLDEKSGFEDAIGVTSFPHSALIAPDGKLTWSGHPSGAGGVVEKAAKASRPTPLLPASCAAVEKLMNEDRRGAACLELRKAVDGGTLQGDDVAYVQGLIAWLEKNATSTWEQAQAALGKKDYAEAAELCERLQSYAGLQPGDQGKAKLAELRADAAIAKEIDGGRENRKAARLEEELEFKEAMKIYKGVVSKYAGTEAGKHAQQRLDFIKNEGLLNMDPDCDLCRKGNRPCSRHQKT